MPIAVTRCVAPRTDTSRSVDYETGYWPAGAGARSMDLAVPEPTTWALMILGLAAAGAALRRRTALAIAR